MRNELQAAVGRFEERVKAGNRSLKKGNAYGIPMGRAEIEFHKDMKLALSALRDMLKRREGCDFCNESEQIQNQYGDIMGMDDGVLILDTEGYPRVTFRIKYCPDCGRELSGNAEQVKEGEG